MILNGNLTATQIQTNIQFIEEYSHLEYDELNAYP